MTRSSASSENASCKESCTTRCWDAVLCVSAWNTHLGATLRNMMSFLGNDIQHDHGLPHCYGSLIIRPFQATTVTSNPQNTDIQTKTPVQACNGRRTFHHRKLVLQSERVWYAQSLRMGVGTVISVWNFASAFSKVRIGCEYSHLILLRTWIFIFVVPSSLCARVGHQVFPLIHLFILSPRSETRR
ncbi:hypothetical protein EDD85DRAFT_244270 [Armillaria nabsnona]|nr:hypothetical protein EDD85DRAFT_244270 [Armillaria nabsnona]